MKSMIRALGSLVGTVVGRLLSLIAGLCFICEVHDELCNCAAGGQNQLAASPSVNHTMYQLDLGSFWQLKSLAVF